MDEGIVRMYAQMYALVAEMYAEVARVEGMKTANAEMEICGGSPAWEKRFFDEASSELNRISGSLNGI